MTETDPEKRLIGYARVSTYGQTLDTQLEQLRSAGCSSRNIYREKATGARASPHARPPHHRPRATDQGTKPMPPDPLDAAVVGCGAIACNQHIRFLTGSDNDTGLRLAATVDPAGPPKANLSGVRHYAYLGDL